MSDSDEIFISDVLFTKTCEILCFSSRSVHGVKIKGFTKYYFWIYALSNFRANSKVVHM